MEFFTQAVNVLKILGTAVGAGLGAWGVIYLMEGYGSDNPGAKSQGIKQLMAGGVSFLSDLSSFHYLRVYSIKKKRRA